MFVWRNVERRSHLYEKRNNDNVSKQTKVGMKGGKSINKVNE